MNYILYADDDADDQGIMEELFPQVLPHVELIIKDNGDDLLRFLDQLDANAELPALIILDLNMPSWDGIQTWRLIKQNQKYHDIPAIIFSTTANEKERNLAFQAGAVAFIRKPSSYSQLQTIIQSFTTYFKPL
jgi:CheY-like chemotaxis protein